jgi:hypothetical protein
MTDEWRAKIQVGAILTRLNKFTLDKDGKIEMTMAQIKAADILLRKRLPDLKAIEVSGPGGGPVQAQVEVTFIRP